MPHQSNEPIPFDPYGHTDFTFLIVPEWKFISYVAAICALLAGFAWWRRRARRKVWR